MSAVSVRRAAGADDIRRVAALRWEWKGDGTAVGEAAFADELVAWAESHTASHTCFVAELGSVMGSRST